MNESVCRPRAKKKTATAAEEAAVVAVEVLPAETLMNQAAWVAEGAEVVAVAEVAAKKVAVAKMTLVEWRAAELVEDRTNSCRIPDPFL